MSDITRDSDEAVASLEESHEDVSPEPPLNGQHPSEPSPESDETPQDELSSENAEPTPPLAAPPHDAPTPTHESTESPVQLARVFSLLALVGVIGALGGLLATYNYFDSRIKSVELGASTSQQILDTKVSAVSKELSKEITANRGIGVRTVVIGGELNRTLYLMNALAEDTTLPAEARAKARAAYDQTSSLLVDLQKMK